MKEEFVSKVFGILSLREQMNDSVEERVKFEFLKFAELGPNIFQSKKSV